MPFTEAVERRRLARRVWACLRQTSPGLSDDQVFEEFCTRYPELAACQRTSLGVEEVVLGLPPAEHRSRPRLLGLTPDYADLPTAVFHLGFIGIEETEEHLERLRREGPVQTESAMLAEITGPKITRPKIARSKIGRTNAIVRPVDRVARRVAPVEDRPAVRLPCPSCGTPCHTPERLTDHLSNKRRCAADVVRAGLLSPVDVGGLAYQLLRTSVHVVWVPGGWAVVAVGRRVREAPEPLSTRTVGRRKRKKDAAELALRLAGVTSEDVIAIPNEEAAP